MFAGSKCDQNCCISPQPLNEGDKMVWFLKAPELRAKEGAGFMVIGPSCLCRSLQLLWQVHWWSRGMALSVSLRHGSLADAGRFASPGRRTGAHRQAGSRPELRVLGRFPKVFESQTLQWTEQVGQVPSRSFSGRHRRPRNDHPYFHLLMIFFPRLLPLHVFVYLSAFCFISRSIFPLFIAWLHRSLFFAFFSNHSVFIDW